MSKPPSTAATDPSPSDTADQGHEEDRPPSDDILLGVPQQHRSRRTLQSFLAASRQLLEEGESAITVSEVARRARVSVGAFYTRFEGRDDLIRYLGERSFEEALEEWEALVDAEGPRLERALAHLAARYLEGPQRTLVLLNGYQDPTPTRLRRFEDRIARDLRLLDPFPSPPAPDDLLRALFLIGGLRELALRAEEGEDDGVVPADPERLAEVAAGMLDASIPGSATESQRGEPSEREPTSRRADGTDDGAAPDDPAAPDEMPAPDDSDVDLFDVWG